MEASSIPSSSTPVAASTPAPEQRWKSLSRDQRRVLGVLVEKSKTTPDVYPMSINGIKTGCNQKSNRSPLLELDDHRVEDVLYELRQLGCVVEVHSGGRVPKYKHQAYEWLNVSKAELGVLTELLLRGEQSLGDLRARSARMEKEIESLDDLRPIVASLKEKDLIVELTPPGRGQILTHNLYLPNELERLKQQFDASQYAVSEDPSDDDNGSELRRRGDAARTPQAGEETVAELTQRVEQLETQLRELKEQLSELRRMVES